MKYSVRYGLIESRLWTVPTRRTTGSAAATGPAAGSARTETSPSTARTRGSWCRTGRRIRRLLLLGPPARNLRYGGTGFRLPQTVAHPARRTSGHTIHDVGGSDSR